MKKTYIIVHGLGGSPYGHWQERLYEKLRESGEEVFFPQFSSNEEPNLNEWLEELDILFRSVKGEKIVVCHSLGVILWFYYAMNYEINNVSDLLLVAPPGKDIFHELKELRTFAGFNISREKLENSAKKIRLVATENDRYCKENAIHFYGKKLALDCDTLPPDSGHINMDSGYGEWPSVFEWCRDTARRLEK